MDDVMCEDVDHIAVESQIDFEIALHAIREEDYPNLMHVISLILCATRPLTLRELRYALAFQHPTFTTQASAEAWDLFISTDEEMEQRLWDWTAGLVQAREVLMDLDNHARTVHFANDSVKEIILKQSGLLGIQASLMKDPQVVEAQEETIAGSALSVDESSTETLPASICASSESELISRSHSALAEVCLNFLAIREIQDVAATYQGSEVIPAEEAMGWVQRLYTRHTLISYSIVSVLEHIAALENLTEDEDLPSLYYERMKPVFPVWRSLHDLYRTGYELVPCGFDTSMLHIAADRGLLQWVKDVDAEADLNAPHDRLGTPLHSAIANGHEKVLNQLLISGANIDKSSPETGTPLCFAVLLRKLTMVEILIQRGANVDAPCGKHGYSLHAACSMGNLEAFQALLEAGARISMRGGTYGDALQAAAFGGNREIVEILIRRNVARSIRDGDFGCAMSAAAAAGHDRIVQLLIDNGVPITQNIRSGYRHAGWVAGQNGHEHVARRVFAHLHPEWDLDRVEEEVAKALLQGQKQSRLHEAVSNGDHVAVRRYLKEKASPSTRAGPWGSSWHTVVLRENLALLKLMLSLAKLGPNQKNRHGQTPLFIAARQGQVEMTRILIDAVKHKWTQQDEDGRNLLWYPARDGNMEIVRMLVEKGVDPGTRDKGNVSPVGIAEEMGHLDVVNFLVANQH
ncbi:ankyrin [Aspergillus ellipticus CBS 707.79]|uniref:Ankyrin n=1 Tax=Aspergillus ellipticus CBS 707.79 TaxID=1448320 RepID=A0A319CZ20_9EURO|nr:ankyrin [Aspergillus ellipticus CBS 707.79]